MFVLPICFKIFFWRSATDCCYFFIYFLFFCHFSILFLTDFRRSVIMYCLSPSTPLFPPTREHTVFVFICYTNEHSVWPTLPLTIASEGEVTWTPNLTQLHTNENTVPTIRSDLYDALRFSVLASFLLLSFFLSFFFLTWPSFIRMRTRVPPFVLICMMLYVSLF